MALKHKAGRASRMSGRGSCDYGQRKVKSYRLMQVELAISMLHNAPISCEIVLLVHDSRS